MYLKTLSTKKVNEIKKIKIKKISPYKYVLNLNLEADRVRMLYFLQKVQINALIGAHICVFVCV